MSVSMKAIRIIQKVSTKKLVPELVEKPAVKEGYALIKVKAFGVNESEITSRKGESSADFSFPRILGIEGVGVIDEVCESSTFEVGQKVATMMGGLGRAIDGSYAEYMLVNEDNIIPIETELDWGIVGGLPEMLQTAYGSVTKGLNLSSGETILICGGSSSVGLMAANIAKQKGAVVISTTRSAKKIPLLKKYGVDYPILDDEFMTENVRKTMPHGVDKVLELVGTTALFQDMSFLKEGGYICFTGALAGEWTINDFSPFMIPTGTFLTSYSGGAKDLPAAVINNILKKIEKKEITVPIAKIYHGLENVGQAQDNLESGKYIGKHVVVL